MKRTTERAKEQVRETAQDVGHEARSMGERAKNRAGEMLESRKREAANRVHDVGDRLEHRGESLEAQGGMKGKAGQALHRAGSNIERGADYVESHRLSTIRDDAKGQIREHPFLTVGTAIGTGFTLGWLAGKAGESDEELRRERFDRAGERNGEERGAFGRMGRAVLTGATMLAARQLRDRIAGTRHRA